MGAWAPSSAGETDPPAKRKGPPGEEKGALSYGLGASLFEGGTDKKSHQFSGTGSRPMSGRVHGPALETGRPAPGDRPPVSIGISPPTSVAGQRQAVLS